jgi:hypothetical protein
VDPWLTRPWCGRTLGDVEVQEEMKWLPFA